MDPQLDKMMADRTADLTAAAKDVLGVAVLGWLMAAMWAVRTVGGSDTAPVDLMAGLLVVGKAGSKAAYWAVKMDAC